jgi:hypothetical protein
MSQNYRMAYDKADRELKRAFGALAGECGGDDGAAETLRTFGRRVRQQGVSEFGNMRCDAWPRLDDVARLEDVANRTMNWPHVTRALAARQGFDLVERVRAFPSDADWCASIAAAVKEFSEAEAAIIAALPDGVTAREIRDGDILREIREAQQRLAQLEALCLRALDDSS